MENKKIGSGQSLKMTLPVSYNRIVIFMSYIFTVKVKKMGVHDHISMRSMCTSIDVELESNHLSGYVRPITLSLFRFDSTQLSCLGRLDAEHLPIKQYVGGLNRTRAAIFFIFNGKGVVQVSCITLL